MWRNSWAVKQRLRSNSASSCSSCGSSGSCSVVSSSSSSSRNSNKRNTAAAAVAPLSTSSSLGSNNSSSSSNSSISDDDLTLNELLGKLDESYLYNKHETEHTSNSNDYSSSANFSSEANSASSSLDRTSTSCRAVRLSGSRVQQQKRRNGCIKQRSKPCQLESKEHGRLTTRRFNELQSKSAETNRALLERLLMKKTLSRRSLMAKPIWTATTLASRSLGGTPICLRRKNPLLQPSAPLNYSSAAAAAAAAKTSQLRACPALVSTYIL